MPHKTERRSEIHEEKRSLITCVCLQHPDEAECCGLEFPRLARESPDEAQCRSSQEVRGPLG